MRITHGLYEAMGASKVTRKGLNCSTPPQTLHLYRSEAATILKLYTFQFRQLGSPALSSVRGGLTTLDSQSVTWPSAVFLQELTCPATMRVHLQGYKARR